MLADDAIQPVYALMFRVLRLYRGMLVFTSLSDLMRISKAGSGHQRVLSIRRLDWPRQAGDRVIDSDRGGLDAQPDNDPYALA